jgi:hypothetical protein
MGLTAHLGWRLVWGETERGEHTANSPLSMC